MPPTLIGSRLRHYKILSKLGEGGMGVVYLAEDERLGRKVALKVLPEDLAADRERLDRFEREARTLAALDHPNIVTIHSVEESDGVRFLTMGLVEGRPLSEVVAKGPVSLRDILAIAVPLADALAAAHRQGVVHRDLKPANIMVGDEGRVRVLDFGLAKLRADGADAAASQLGTEAFSEALTGAGTVLGTVPYMSPEQVQGEELDGRSDVFSLGVILYEMATGSRPFRGGNPPSLMSSILRDQPAPVNEIRSELPARFARVVRRCLQKNPDRRYQTALDLRNELEELATDIDSGAVEEMPSPQTARRPRRSSVGRMAGAAGLVALVALLYWLGRGRAAEPPIIRGLEQLTSETSLELFPTLSPDGRFVAYASVSGDDSDIHLRRIGGGRAIDLTEGSAAYDSHPAFSPDGESIAFWSTRDGGGLFVMGATGESVRRIAAEGFHPDWSPDGRRIVYSTGEPVETGYARAATSALRIVDLESGEDHLLTEGLGGSAIQPKWSPDGRRIAYWDLESATRDIFTIASEGGFPVAVTRDEAVDWSPAWSPEGGGLVFSSDRGGAMNLWWVSLDPRTGEPRAEAEPITTNVGGEVSHVAFSQDGRAGIYAAYEEESNIERLELGPGARSTEGASWLTEGTLLRQDPDVSADGRIAYVVGRTGDIVLSDRDGSGVMRLTEDEYRDRWPRWSPDGKRLAFTSNRSGSVEIWTVASDGTDLEQLTFAGEKRAIRPAWSPDGRRLAYSGLPPVDDYHTYILDLTRPWSEQEVRRIEPPEGFRWFQTHSWSGDDRLVGFGSDGAETAILLYSLEAGGFEVLARGDVRAPRWLHDDRTIVFLDGNAIHALDTVTRERWELRSLGQDRTWRLSVAPDDSALYYHRLARRADLWLMRLERD